ncbi:DUF2345 domain-containing protein, partial [Chromobacterium vaccinii]|uniref:DUF2345 domain-containing protein n=1 Tax=Chromobacterium vaccinii TaxID=1108595 RepID=UPI00345A528D
SATEQSQTVSAGQNLNLIAQRDANHATGRRWLHNVGKSISLFVAGVKDKVALKLIAAKGKVQVQAQSDAMELTADKDLTITSAKQKIHLNGKQEILLTRNLPGAWLAAYTLAFLALMSLAQAVSK